MTDDIAQWLGEQLDEDERIARAASAGPWTKCVGYISGGPDARVRVAQQAQGWNADHIVEHDPARVLREIEAKRQVLAEHAPGRPKGRPNMAMHCQSCTTAQAWDDVAKESNCRTLRLLALPYTDRPGYREDWRP